MNVNGAIPHIQEFQPIAVDTAGGDNGIGVVVEGAVDAFHEFGIKTILVGPKSDIEKKLSSLGADLKFFPIFHAPDVIEMDESPVRAVRRKPDSSLCVAYNLVQNNQASSLISAGNSGAMMAAGRIICGLFPGIERPAIATPMPVAGEGNPNVVLDSGANVDCHAIHLVQFAIMGSVYYSALFGINRPKVALLSNGTEPSKGTDVIRAAAHALSSMESINYVGYVEGRDLALDKANVIVCDGFVGNVMLKSMEGGVRLIAEQLKIEAKKSFFRRLAMLGVKGIFRDVFYGKFDYTSHGGAPLLGLKKLAIVLHGSSDKRAVKNAIRVADGFARTGMTEKIFSELAKLEENGENHDNEINFPLGKMHGNFKAEIEIEKDE